MGHGRYTFKLYFSNIHNRDIEEKNGAMLLSVIGLQKPFEEAALRYHISCITLCRVEPEEAGVQAPGSKAAINSRRTDFSERSPSPSYRLAVLLLVVL